MKRVECDECAGLNGIHARWCVSRGYPMVGPHPNAPAAEPRPSAPGPDCLCGRPRAGCEYHDPALQPAPAASREPTDCLTCAEYVAKGGICRACGSGWIVVTF